MSKVNAKSYVWWQDNKMLAMILLIIVGAMQIFAFLKIPFLSSIPRYTIGMLIGFFNPFFYIYVAYKLLKVLFPEKMTLPRWVKLNDISYGFVVLAIIFISTSLSFYQNKTGYTAIGSKPWHSFDYWFDSFKGSSAWAPSNTNGGLVGVFVYSLFASISSGIGAIIISIILLALSASFVITGSSLGLYKNLKNKKELLLKDKEIKNDKQMNVDNLITDPDPIDKDIKISHTQKMKQKKKEDEEFDFPFEDPFS